MDPNERVLCVPTARFRDIGYFNGFNPKATQYMSLLNDKDAVFLARGDCEEDPSYKQLIPYIALRHMDGEQHYLLRYYRTKKAGEGRLRGKASIGIGGHINPGDGLMSVEEIFSSGWRRELHEELKVESMYKSSLVGVINDDTDPVGQVHLGFLLVLDLDSQKVSANDDSLYDVKMVPIQELVHGPEETLDEFESWSRIVLESDAFGN